MRPGTRLSLVQGRYGVSREQIVEIAPLLFFLVAEQSLQGRRQRVADLLESGCEPGRDAGLEALHLPVQGLVSTKLRSPARNDLSRRAGISSA